MVWTLSNASPNSTYFPVFEKIPTLTDGPVTIPDSGAALLYLATKHDSTTFSFPHDTQAFWTMTQLLFYASQIDFLQGNSWRARVLAKEAGEEFTPSKISDYLDTQLFRSYRLLDKKLAQERASYGAAEVEKSGGPWLAGNKYSYADMAIYPYYAKASQYVWAKAKLDQFKELTAWAERVGARDAVKKGMLKGEEFGEVL